MSHKIYKMNEPYTSQSPFKLLYVTHSEYDKGWNSTPHSHHFTELFYIVSGRGSFMLSNHEFPVEKNDLVIINPNIEHTETSNQLDSLEYIALGLEGISFTLSEKDTETGLFTYRGDREDILFYFKKLLQEVSDANINFETVCQNIIEILVIKLQRDKNIEMKNDKPQQLNRSVVLAKNYIDQNYMTSITLDMLAKIANANKYYLAHVFKEEINFSPIEYLTKVRIKEAKTHLETTNFSIAQVSEFNGFSSQSLFSQAFKREMNLTPSEYRKRSLHNTK